MEEYKIENFEDLVKGHLDRNLEYVGYTAKSLTGPGENYGSIMLAVDIICKNKINGSEEIVKAVAKTPPPSEFMQKIFNTDVTFKAEIEFYRTVFPMLQDLQREHGLRPLEYHAKFLGGRLNLKNTDEMDLNGALIMENIIVKGYNCGDRIKGYDLDTIELILKDLANFHATGIALKQQRPLDFKNKVKPYLDLMIFCDNEDAEKFVEDNRIATEEILGEREEMKKFIPSVNALLKEKCDNSAKEPFATIVHQDLWVNNLMLKKQNDKYVKNKFVDFQMCRYVSPADDLFFIILTSVQNEILLNKWDHLVSFYHKELIENLEKLKVNTTPFSREAFNQEIKDSYQRQYVHATCMLFPILMEKSKAKPITKDFNPETEPKMVASPAHKEKLCTIVKLYNKNGWL